MTRGASRTTSSCHPRARLLHCDRCVLGRAIEVREKSEPAMNSANASTVPSIGPVGAWRLHNEEQRRGVTHERGGRRGRVHKAQWLWMLGALVGACIPTLSCALPVFPSAEGFGIETPAGRGGAVVHVTTIAARGAGSLRECVEQSGARVCIFDVSGEIDLTSVGGLVVTKPFLTIAGQTAPSPGITLRGAALTISTHDVLVQHLRVRVGDNTAGPDPQNRDGIQLENGAIDVVVDHCSVSWAVDGSIDIYNGPLGTTPCTGASNITISNSIIAEHLDASLHPHGPHSLAFLIDNDACNLSVLRTLFAHNRGRNPLQSTNTQLLYVNNVIYDTVESSGWVVSGSARSGPSLATVIGNVAITGPTNGEPGYVGVALANNAPGTQYYGADNQCDESICIRDDGGWRVDAPPIQTTPPIVPLPSAGTQSHVLANAGARPADRDTVDDRVVSQVEKGIGSIIDSQDDVGGWPALESNQTTHFLPTDPNGDADADGYTNLEEWLHQLAAEVEGATPSSSSAPTASSAAASPTSSPGSSHTASPTTDSSSPSSSPLKTASLGSSPTAAPMTSLPLTAVPTNLGTWPTGCAATIAHSTNGGGTGTITGNINAVVAVECQDGYDGSSDSTCLPTGEFTSVVCTVKSCMATEVPNSQDHTNARSLAGFTGDVVLVDCNDGYAGGGAATCQPNGLFEFEPCSRPTSSPTKGPGMNASPAATITPSGAAIMLLTAPSTCMLWFLV